MYNGRGVRSIVGGGNLAVTEFSTAATIVEGLGLMLPGLARARHAAGRCSVRSDAQVGHAS